MVKFRAKIIPLLATATAAGLTLATGATASASTNTAVIPVGVAPTGVVACNGEIYVANYTSNTVSVIDPASNTVSRTINVSYNSTAGFSPYGMTCSGTTLYVANYDSDNVSIIDTTSQLVTGIVSVAVSGSPPAAQGPTGLVVQGGYLYVSLQTSGYVARIDTTTRQVFDRIRVGGNTSPDYSFPVGLASLNGMVYVGNQDGEALGASRLAANGTETIINIGYRTSFVATSQDAVYFLSSDPSIFRLAKVSPSTLQVVGQVTLPNRPTNLTIAGNTAYVTSYGGNEFYVIDLTTLSLTEIVPSASGSAGVATLGSAIYVSRQASNNVGVFGASAASGEQTPTAPMQGYAKQVGKSCGVDVPAEATWPGLMMIDGLGWSESWAEWPNGGTGGYVCVRQPYYTTAGTWAVQ
jgi:YVTN family beta-propeller protein